MGHRLLILIFTTLLAWAPPSDFPCKRIYNEIGQRYPLTRDDIERIVHGDANTSFFTAMGTNALSYLAAATHLTGEQKADVWEQAVRRIIILTHQPFSSEPQHLLNTHIRAYRGDTAQLVVFDLRTGQVYRGTALTSLEPNWNFQAAVDSGQLRPLGDPGRAVPAEELPKAP